MVWLSTFQLDEKLEIGEKKLVQTIVSNGSFFLIGSILVIDT